MWASYLRPTFETTYLTGRDSLGSKFRDYVTSGGIVVITASYNTDVAPSKVRVEFKFKFESCLRRGFLPFSYSTPLLLPCPLPPASPFFTTSLPPCPWIAL